MPGKVVEKPVAEEEIDKPVRKASEEVKPLWSYEAGGEVWSVAIGDGYVAAGSEDNKVYLFDYSGKLLWSYKAGDWVSSVAIYPKNGRLWGGSHGVLPQCHHTDSFRVMQPRK